MREQVKKLVAEGKTGSAIAKEVGISLPSVQNIKKAAGLVNKR
jgi:DNA-binding CsgD family transcriptional regulator